VDVAEGSVKTFSLRVESRGISRGIGQGRTFFLELLQLLGDFLPTLEVSCERYTSTYLLLLEQMLPPYVGIQNSLDSRGIITSDLP
jgi:hypothetical protein